MPVLKNRRWEAIAQLASSPKKLSLSAIAKEAGFSTRQNVHKVLRRPEVKKRVAELQAKMAAKAEVDGARVLKEFERIAFSRVTDYMTIGEDGLPIIDFAHMTEDQKVALAEIQVDMLDVEKDGKRQRETKRVKFKLHDKLTALAKLAAHHGVCKDQEQKLKLTVDGRIEFVSGFSEEPAGSDAD